MTSDNEKKLQPNNGKSVGAGEPRSESAESVPSNTRSNKELKSPLLRNGCEKRKEMTDTFSWHVSCKKGRFPPPPYQQKEVIFHFLQERIPRKPLSHAIFVTHMYWLK